MTSLSNRHSTSRHSSMARRSSGLNLPRFRVPVDNDGRALTFFDNLLNFRSLHMRTFHITWVTFFICFYAWFSVSNLSYYIQQDLNLDDHENSIALGVSSLSTLLFRIIFGDLCDKIGPRWSYFVLLIASSVALTLMALASLNSTSFIICSFLIGIIGASFVITQYHTTVFFSPKRVGTANAFSAGWGNFGGGVVQVTTPLICNLLVHQLGVSNHNAWRLALAFPIVLLLCMAVIYGIGYVKDSPTPKCDADATGNVGNGTMPMMVKTSTTSACPSQLSETEAEQSSSSRVKKLFDMSAYKVVPFDHRVWILSLSYGASFGIEITILNFVSNYFQLHFGVSLKTAGVIVFFFSVVNLFGRGCGGILADLLYVKYGVQGRVYCLFLVLISESVFFYLFAVSDFHLGYTILMMFIFSFYVQAAEGVVFAIVPSLQNARYLGFCMGFVAAGGNFIAMLFSFILFFNVPDKISYSSAWIICGVFVFACAFPVLRIRFSKQEIRDEKLRTVDFLITTDNIVDDRRADFALSDFINHKTKFKSNLEIASENC